MATLVDLSQLQAQLAALQAENAKLKANKANGGTGIKVSAKGAISVYGHGRFPTTLYASQWLSVLDKADDIRAFINTNKALLAYKD